MPADQRAPSDPSPRLIALSGKKLWFGFAGAVFAWIVLGCAEITIIWRGCMRQEDYGVPPSHPWVSVLLTVITLLILAITVGAGMISYRNFKQLSAQASMLESLAVQRGEFMAVTGVIVSATLAMGMVWLALPPLFIDLCWRAR
jgi:hypothetical protein